MKLVDLQITGNLDEGWGSGVLSFGEHLTQLFGPNGCGKTPVIQSIAFALGYPIKYRDDILQNCEFVILRVLIDQSILIIKRNISGDIRIECTYLDGENEKDIETFYNLKDYSKYLLEMMGLSTPALISTRNKAVAPYLSTLLPLYYICLLYTSPSPRDATLSRMPSSA